MADIDLAFIGTELRRLQQEMRELRIRVDFNNSEGRALYDVLREEMGRSVAGLHARMDAFDQRFTYLDETISRLQQDMTEQRQEMTVQRQEMNNQFAELKALLLAGRGGLADPPPV